MKTKSLLTLIAVGLATVIARGAPADDVSAAAKKLADAPNYSWTATTQNNGGGGGGGGGRGFGAGPVSGKTEKGGYTLTSRKFQDNEIQTLRKGDQFATQNFQSGEWQSPEEMRAAFGGGGGGAGGGRGGRGGGFGANQTNPAEDAVALAEAAKDLKVVDGAIVGTLSSEAVGPRLFGGFGGRGGRGGGGGGGGGPQVQNGSGTVKFWVKDGVLSKYELNVKGTFSGQNGEVQIDRTTTTEIKDVGSTKVSPPEAAVKKLGA